MLTHEAQPETDDRHLHLKHYLTTTGRTLERRKDSTVTTELSATKDTGAVL
jgi:hypothetical protein